MMIESLWKWPVAFLFGLFALAGGAAAHDRHVHTTAAPAKAARAELGAGIAVAPDGVWHAVTLRDGQIVLHRSTDAGQHWIEPRQFIRTRDDGEAICEAVLVPA